MSLPEFMASVPLFAGLEPQELADFLGIFKRVSFTGTTVIVRQGQPADSAFVLESGTVEVVTALPGGGQFVIGELGTGSVLGEMALLDGGVRSATAVARVPTVAHVVGRDEFRMLLSQRHPAVFKIQRRITLMLCQRLRELNAKVAANSAHSDGGLPRISAVLRRPARRAQCAFDYQPFLPILPQLRHFRTEDLDELLALGTVFDAARGTPIFHENDFGASCYMVIRGAIEIIAAKNDEYRRIGVLGPGRWCGILALIEGRPHSMTAILREDTTLLEIDLAAFQRVYGDRTHLAARFHDVLNGELLVALSRTNNHLTRLISQARIRARSTRAAPMLDVDDLQRALGSQDCLVASG